MKHCLEVSNYKYSDCETLNYSDTNLTYMESVLIT